MSSTLLDAPLIKFIHKSVINISVLGYCTGRDLRSASTISTRNLHLQRLAWKSWLKRPSYFLANIWCE